MPLFFCKKDDFSFNSICFNIFLKDFSESFSKEPFINTKPNKKGDY